jgi:hypothetical protein
LVAITETENAAEFEEGCQCNLKQGTELDRAVETLVTQYIELEQYLMRKNIEIVKKQNKKK